MTGRSPPGPLRCGSTTWSTKPAATAASNALPPRSSTDIPAADASQCVEATMPNVPRSSGRVVNTRPKVALEDLRRHDRAGDPCGRDRVHETVLMPGDERVADAEQVRLHPRADLARALGAQERGIARLERDRRLEHEVE